MQWLGCQRQHYGRLTLIAYEREAEDFAPLWFEKIHRALALIERVAPRTAVRLQQDVERIVVESIRGPDYVLAIKAIRINGPLIHHQEVERVALTLVHEATHARIAARGIAYSRDQRGRHERICTAAEVRFAMKLPNGDSIGAALQQRLETPWWTDEALRKRSLAEFDRLKLGGPVGRFLRRRIERMKFHDD